MTNSVDEFRVNSVKHPTLWFNNYLKNPPVYPLNISRYEFAYWG